MHASIVQQVGSNPFCIPLIIYIITWNIYGFYYIYLYRSKTTHHLGCTSKYSAQYVLYFSLFKFVTSLIRSSQWTNTYNAPSGYRCNLAASPSLPPSLSLSLSPAKHFRLEEEMVYLLYPMISSSFIQRFPIDSPMFNVRIRCFVPFSETTQQIHAQSTYLSCLLLGVDIGF